MLQVRNLTVRYRSVTAVRNVSFDINEGSIVALVGANGAGKSSVLESISGMKRPVEGQILFQGERIETQRAHNVMNMGIAHVPEGRLIFTRLSVGENLEVATPKGLARFETLARREKVLSLLPELADRLNMPASTLSGGQQQLLAVGRGLMAAPRLLLLDEPTLGLSPVATSRMFALMADLAAEGMTLLLVDQNVNRVLRLVSEVHVLDNGEITLAGSAQDLSRDIRIKEAFLGGS